LKQLVEDKDIENEELKRKILSSHNKASNNSEENKTTIHYFENLVY
jgi:hypothetical protein